MVLTAGDCTIVSAYHQYIGKTRNILCSYLGTVVDFDQGVDIEVLQNRYTEGSRNGDLDRVVTWAGTGVGLMNKIQPAKEIVKELHMECLESMRALTSLY